MADNVPMCVGPLCPGFLSELVQKPGCHLPPTQGRRPAHRWDSSAGQRLGGPCRQPSKRAPRSRLFLHLFHQSAPSARTSLLLALQTTVLQSGPAAPPPTPSLWGWAHRDLLHIFLCLVLRRVPRCERNRLLTALETSAPTLPPIPTPMSVDACQWLEMGYKFPPRGRLEMHGGILGDKCYWYPVGRGHGCC